MGDFSGTVPSHTAGEEAVASKFQTLDDFATATTAAWTSYTPTLTNLTQGNGTVVATYRRLGKILDLRFKFTLGSTSAVSTNPAISLPTGMTMSSYYGDFIDPVGGVMLIDTGVATRGGFLLPDHTNNRLLIGAYTTAGVFQNVTSTAPHTWATADIMSLFAMGLELT